MNITIPIYIEQQPQPNQPPVYLVRPLFLIEPAVRDEELQRAVTKFVKASRKLFNKLGKQMRQTGIAEYTFAPDIEEHTLQFSLNLKEKTANCKFLFITFNALGRRIAFTPSIQGLWFEIERGESLQGRAAEVLTDHFRNRDKRGAGYVPKAEEITLQGTAQTGLVELQIELPLLGVTPKEEFRALLFGNDEMNGEWELQGVGRCLNELYPDDLTRITGREKELDELARLLKAPDRRPVLLMGPRMAGKSALIEEHVFRRTARRKSSYKNKNNIWLLAPQRLISGMSFVGQWENRLLAIVKEARKRNHTLYFDDLLGLFKAGISASSNLTVAHVLKHYIERREVRVLAEITPEAWRVLRELDRGFADLFHVLSIRESSEDETIAMSIGLIRDLEARHHCRFTLEALPAAIALARRYVRESAFPGKSAAMLRQLAIKYRGSAIGREEALMEFQAKSGLAMHFLAETDLAREEITEALRQSVVGQPAAIEACADVLVTAKARLNDPARPLASMLFLGPTGVGKTQCAKSLASYLFSGEDRLVRYDMNEFISYDSVARLVGTFDQPEGLLTSAIRRQPFSVILFDEIEKAHPDVFNLLLQVMGEGRLTDSIGRTADFTNAIVILTSNLGVKEAASELGFNTTRVNESGIYTQAAEKFFSPEFFNRLDRIVPFSRLNRATVGKIAENLVWGLFNREGVVRRKIVLRIDPRAQERIVDAGFHPQLGARALKREIEKQLAQPVARSLAATPITAPTIIDILPGRTGPGRTGPGRSGPGRSGLRVEMQALVEAPLHEALREGAVFDRLLARPESTIERILDFLDRIEETLEELRPEGAIPLDAIQPAHKRYFALNEQTRALHNTADWLARQYEPASHGTTRLTARGTRKPPVRFDGRLRMGSRRFWKEFFAAEDIHAFLRELASPPKDESQPLKAQLAQTLREAALIDLYAAAESASPRRALLLVRSLTNSIHSAVQLAALLEESYGKQFGLEVRLLSSSRKINKQYAWWLTLDGWEAMRLARAEAGIHLFFDKGRAMRPVQVKAFAMAEEERPRAAIKSRIKEYRQWQVQLAPVADDAAAGENPWPLDPVVRIYAEDEPAAPTTTVDLRTGLTVPRFPNAADLRSFIAASLPLPPELID